MRNFLITRGKKKNASRHYLFIYLCTHFTCISRVISLSTISFIYVLQLLAQSPERGVRAIIGIITTSGDVKRIYREHCRGSCNSSPLRHRAIIRAVIKRHGYTACYKSTARGETRSKNIYRLNNCFFFNPRNRFALVSYIYNNGTRYRHCNHICTPRVIKNSKGKRCAMADRSPNEPQGRALPIWQYPRNDKSTPTESNASRCTSAFSTRSVTSLLSLRFS